MKASPVQAKTHLGHGVASVKVMMLVTAMRFQALIAAIARIRLASSLGASSPAARC